MMITLIAVTVGVLLLNMPFGFWRAGVQKFTLPWILAVHLPIPFVVALRIVSGLGWSLASFPFVIGAYLTGQYLGGALHRSFLRRGR